MMGFLTTSLFSQTGGSLNTIDPSANPQGVGFGGAMGGTTAAPAPSTSPGAIANPGTTAPGTSTGYGRGNDFSSEQYNQEQMQDTNYAGGSLGGRLENNNSIPETTIPETSRPAVPPTQPSTVPRQTAPVGTGTGVGTGSPSP